VHIKCGNGELESLAFLPGLLQVLAGLIPFGLFQMQGC
jgi:hypothetical protein